VRRLRAIARKEPEHHVARHLTAMLDILDPSDRTDSARPSFANRQTLAMLLFSSANAAINPYKNIFGVDVIGIPPAFYSLVILFSGLVVTFVSVRFGSSADRHGSFARYILICGACGLLGNLIVYAWPNAYTYLCATCLLLPIFCVLNSLIFGYAAARRQAGQDAGRHHANAVLRSAYSMGYVLTLGLIGALTLRKDQLIHIWLFSAIVSGLICALYARQKLSEGSLRSDAASEPISRVLHGRNLVTLLSVSLITNMLFTLDATAPLIIVDQAHGGYSSIGVFEAGIAVCEIGFIFLWSAVAQRTKASTAIITGALVFAVAILLFSATRTVTHVYLLIPALALGAACLISVPIGYLQSLATDRPGIGGSLLSISFFVSSTVSSAIYFLGSRFADPSRTIYISTGVALLGLAMLSSSRRT